MMKSKVSRARTYPHSCGCGASRACLRTSPPAALACMPVTRPLKQGIAAGESEKGGSDSRRGARQEYGESDGESEEEEQQPGAKRARKSGGRRTQRQPKAPQGWRGRAQRQPPRLCVSVQP